MKTNNSPTSSDYVGIHFYNESGAAVPVHLSFARKIAALIEQTEQCRFQFVEIAFVDEQEIVRVNKEHLDRDYITDIISFRYDEDLSNQAIEGTLYCCTQRIKKQAAEYHQPLKTEFRRIIIHGLLHLNGYEDRNEAFQKQMHNREDFYLGQL